MEYIVKDYMQKKVVTVHPDNTVEEVIHVMIGKKTNGVVVLDEQNKVVGILSSWDMIKHIVPDYLEEDGHLASFEASDVFAKRVHAVRDDKISNFMTKKVKTVKEDCSLMVAITLLSEFHIRQLPVVDDEYVNRTDIKKAVEDVLKGKKTK
ncbi:MAG: hypothetical protein COV59_00905 [Candidatus Magasanikbacteria bacterium CG11_big_fil_rev_8_21_14_0_20_39_34]|uniref:CBS domain-containing protein n=1 Tax=Candidatus Magasanikbacteria bacterium CG11_big_fil_rev_8_21_14_0_20_39_34 TaxID=1974653 RepID=A0A2H0N656_9BACT|nr:MAG: hypothetical protein COV59_00905 [Candidatus Magasanikbacteria bacterium CG11_big_fil_rev_8_21_14_0_20_39_34]